MYLNLNFLFFNEDLNFNKKGYEYDRKIRRDRYCYPLISRWRIRIYPHSADVNYSPCRKLRILRNGIYIFYRICLQSCLTKWFWCLNYYKSAMHSEKYKKWKSASSIFFYRHRIRSYFTIFEKLFDQYQPLDWYWWSWEL